MESIILAHEAPPADWGEIWRTVEKVTPAEWDGLRTALKQAYARITSLIHDNPAWNEDSISAALALIVHTAYHLGEIRQTLCVLT